jgi:anti-sigma B factor antagonist
MALEMKARTADGVTILDLEGKLLCGREADTLRESLLKLFGQGHTQILLNLENVRHADSGGLGDLVAAYTAITRRGGAIKILRPHEKIRGMLRLTHIDSLLEIWDDESASVASFGPAGGTRGMDTLSDFLNG